VVRIELPKSLDKMFGDDGGDDEPAPKKGGPTRSPAALPPTPPPSPPAALNRCSTMGSCAAAAAWGDPLPNRQPSRLPAPGHRGSHDSSLEEQSQAADTIHYFASRKQDVELAKQMARERRAARVLTAYVRRRMRIKIHKQKRTLCGRLTLLRHRFERPFREKAAEFRNWLLYYHMPFDQSFFGKISMWQSVMLLIIAAYPGWYARATFFTIILLCLCRELEEFQIIRFILGLKGTGCVSGLINAVKIAMGLWHCTVLEPMTCHITGPGVGSGVFEQILVICWLQVLVWVAFMLMPYTSKRTEAGPVSGKHRHGLLGALLGNKKQKKKEKARVKAEKKAARKAAVPVGAIGYVPLEELPPRTDLDGLPVYDYEPGRCCNFSGDNRMVVLLFWDLLCFVGVSCLYYFSLAVIDERPNPVDPFAFTHCPGGNASALDALSHKVEENWDEHRMEEEMSVWTNWQAQITFQVCRVLFSISSFPFLFFMVPFLRTLFTHTQPTGYNKRGECVLIDPQGFSGFLSWLRDMLARRSTRGKLLAADAARLRQAVQEGERLLHDYPFSKKLHSKKLRETNDLLAQIITYQHPLFAQFWPNQVLTREFEKGLAEQGLLSTKSQKMYEQRVKTEQKDIKSLRKQNTKDGGLLGAVPSRRPSCYSA
jgi:hypothetical protein